MSIIVVKKCVAGLPDWLEAFDSGDQAYSGSYAEPANLPADPDPTTWDPPYDGCITDPDAPIPRTGLIQNVCQFTGSVGGYYYLPTLLRPGIYDMGIVVTMVTTLGPSEVPDDDEPCKITFLAEGWPVGFPYTPDAVKILQDSTSLEWSFEAGIPSGWAAADDYCDCSAGYIPLFQWFYSLNCRSTGTIRITGSFVSDFPP